MTTNLKKDAFPPKSILEKLVIKGIKMKNINKIYHLTLFSSLILSSFVYLSGILWKDKIFYYFSHEIKDENLVAQLKNAVQTNMILEEIKKKVNIPYDICTDRYPDKYGIEHVHIGPDPDHSDESLSPTKKNVIIWFKTSGLFEGGYKIVGIYFDDHNLPHLFYSIYYGHT